MTTREVLIRDIAALEKYARDILGRLPFHENEATVLGLSGDLGAGKTAFAKALAKALGVTEEVLSPTFVIAKYYDLKSGKWERLVHIDLYRIEEEGELTALRLRELFRAPRTLVLIEWPERMGDKFPEHAARLSLGFVDETTRAIIGDTTI